MIIELLPTAAAAAAAAAAAEAPLLLVVVGGDGDDDGDGGGDLDSDDGDGGGDLDSLGIDIDDARTAEFESSDAAAESPNPDSSPGFASDNAGDSKHDDDDDDDDDAGGERNAPEDFVSEWESIQEADSDVNADYDSPEHAEQEHEEEAYILSAMLGISMEEIVSGLEWLQRSEPDEFNALVRDITDIFDLLGFGLDSSQVRELNDDRSASASRRVRSLILCVDRFVCIVSAIRSTQGSLRRGSHLAASRLAVESLPSVLVAVEDFGADGMLCVVCGDEISFGDWATPLPCSHYYHDDCIVPWLRIRNTCPLCRRELPAEENLE